MPSYLWGTYRFSAPVISILWNFMERQSNCDVILREYITCEATLGALLAVFRASEPPNRPLSTRHPQEVIICGQKWTVVAKVRQWWVHHKISGYKYVCQVIIFHLTSSISFSFSCCI